MSSWAPWSWPRCSYHGDITRDLRPYLPDAVARELEAAGIPATFTLDKTRTFLDNAFLTWHLGSWRIRAGKQQLSWGPAYSFNPTDLFHRKDLLDPTYEKEGVGALRVDYTWGLGGELSVITSPADELGASGYAARWATHFSSVGYDVALTVHQVMDSTGLEAASLLPYRQRRRAVGLELSGELLGLGVWMEGNHNWMRRESDFARFVVGADYTLEGGTYLLGEALYNGRAEEDAPYPVHDWLANLYYGEPVGRWWILTGAQHDVWPLVAGSLYLFSSPDGSFVFNPRLDVSISQDAELTAFGGVTFGDENGSFPPGLTALIARATVYF